MDKLKELRKKQEELNNELEKVVQDIYKELGSCKVGDLFFNGDEYFRILSLSGYKAEVLVYSFEDNLPYMDVTTYNMFQLNCDKVDNDNGILNKIKNYLNNYD